MPTYILLEARGETVNLWDLHSEWGTGPQAGRPREARDSGHVGEPRGRGRLRGEGREASRGRGTAPGGSKLSHSVQCVAAKRRRRWVEK